MLSKNFRSRLFERNYQSIPKALERGILGSFIDWEEFDFLGRSSIAER